MPTISVPDAHGGAEHVVEVNDAKVRQFVDRVRKVAKERRKWAKREHIACYRVYDADIPEYNVAIELFEGKGESEGNRYCVVAEYRAPASIGEDEAVARFEDVLAVVPFALDVPAENVFAKQRRKAKGGGQYTHEQHESHVAFTTEPDYLKQTDYLIELDFSGYLDTGLFLDHRVTRQMVGKMARDTRFLNLFSYTGTATLHAAGGGAFSTTTVDMSQTYLDRARRNMQRNGFTGAPHHFVRADVTSWIVQEAATSHRYDLVFCDPPTFSNGKAMGERTWDVQRDHAKLLQAIARVLKPEGTIVFSCNLRGFKIDAAALDAVGLSVQDISDETIPHDFERNPKIHRCFLVKRAG